MACKLSYRSMTCLDTGYHCGVRSGASCTWSFPPKEIFDFQQQCVLVSVVTCRQPLRGLSLGGDGMHGVAVATDTEILACLYGDADNRAVMWRQVA